MYLKIAKVFLIYGGLLFLGTLLGSIILNSDLLGASGLILQFIVNTFLSWLSGYYGVKALHKIEADSEKLKKILRSSLMQGAAIGLFVGILDLIITYVLLKEFSIGPTIIFVAFAGLGGLRAKKDSDKVAKKL